MVPVSLPFIVLTVSYCGMPERIVPELQSIFAVPIYGNRNENGNPLKRALVQYLACVQNRNIVDSTCTKCTFCKQILFLHQQNEHTSISFKAMLISVLENVQDQR